MPNTTYDGREISPDLSFGALIVVYGRLFFKEERLA